MRLFLVLAGVVALTAAVVAVDPSFTCGCFRNDCDSELYAIMCSSYIPPKSLTGWGRNLKSWKSIDCHSCMEFKCAKSEDGDVSVIHKDTGEEPDPAPENPDLPAVVTADDGSVMVGDYPAAHCCGYARKLYCYAKDLMTVLHNPQSGKLCDSQHYGRDIVGTWIDPWHPGVRNECFFVSGHTSYPPQADGQPQFVKRESLVDRS